MLKSPAAISHPDSNPVPDRIQLALKTDGIRMKKSVAWILAASVAAIAATAILWLHLHHWKPRSITIQGAVLRHDPNASNELPIAGAEVTASDGLTTITSYSDASGYFKLALNAGVWPQRAVSLQVEDAGYRPLALAVPLGLGASTKKLFV